MLEMKIEETHELNIDDGGINVYNIVSMMLFRNAGELSGESL
jgi:hypothetical protein